MPARQKVTNEAVLAAYAEWNQSLRAAAEALGLDRRALRERLVRLGVNLQAPMGAWVRDGRLGHAGTAGGVSLPVERPKEPVRKSQVGDYPAPGRRPNFQPMPAQSLATVDEKEPEAPPVKASARPPRPLRVKPSTEDEFERWRLRVSAQLGYDVDRIALFDQLVLAGMVGFFETLLRDVAKKPNGKKKGGGA